MYTGKKLNAARICCRTRGENKNHIQIYHTESTMENEELWAAQSMIIVIAHRFASFMRKWFHMKNMNYIFAVVHCHYKSWEVLRIATKCEAAEETEVWDLYAHVNIGRQELVDIYVWFGELGEYQG